MSIGIALVALGLGSLYMRHRGQHYVFLSWAEGMQPFFGVGMTVAGIIIIALVWRARAAHRRHR